MVSFFKKTRSTSEKPLISNQKSNVTASNWYQDRYQSTVVQRNILFLMIVLLLVIVFASIFTVLHISNSRTVQPFVIEIEEKTGIPNVIRPYVPKQFTVEYTYDEAIRRYFLLKYLRAREEYDYHNFKYDYFTIVRSLSDKDVYSHFRAELYGRNNNSPLLLGQKGKISLTIRSIKHLPPSSGQGYLVQIAFVRNVSSPNRNYSENKIATIGYDYRDIKMNDEEREINPLGFEVFSYRVDDYTL